MRSDPRQKRRMVWLMGLSAALRFYLKGDDTFWMFERQPELRQSSGTHSPTWPGWTDGTQRVMSGRRVLGVVGVVTWCWFWIGKRRACKDAADGAEQCPRGYWSWTAWSRVNETGYRDSGRTGDGELDMLCVTMSERAESVMDLKFLNILWRLGHNCRPLEQISPPMAVGGDVDVMQKLQECIRRVSIFNLKSVGPDVQIRNKQGWRLCRI